MKKDGVIPNSKWNILILDNEKETCTLIDVANIGDRNMIKKKPKRFLKYKDLK
jgi:hypothetical protein